MKYIFRIIHGIKLRNIPSEPIFIGSEKVEDPVQNQFEKINLIMNSDNKLISIMCEQFKKKFNFFLKTTPKTVKYVFNDVEYDFNALSSGFKSIASILINIILGQNSHIRTLKSENIVIFIEEPEAFLSLNNMLKISQIIQLVSKKLGAKFIISTHSDIMLTLLTDKIDNNVYEFKNHIKTGQNKSIKRLKENEASGFIMQALKKINKDIFSD